MFAWQDAMELAQMFETEYSPAEARKFFDGYSQKWIKKVEDVLAPDIAKMLAATPRGRDAILRKLRKEFHKPEDPRHQYDIIVTFFIVCIIAQLRVEKMIRLRDYYRTIMGPGSGNRATCAGWYDFSREMAKIETDYEFPAHVFNAYGTGLNDEESEIDDFEGDD